MHPAGVRIFPRFPFRLGARWRLLALMIATTPPLRAAGTDVSAPPSYPDRQHVPNGCFISSVAFVARFQADYPTERAQTLALELSEFRGNHTIAVLTWRGKWWGRDEFFGVFPLDRPATAGCDPDRLTPRVQTVLAAHAKREVRAGRARYATPSPREMPTADRSSLIGQAALALPCQSEVFWVAAGGEAVPMLFFRPSPELMCVYEPLTGTGQATAQNIPSIGLVKLFAAKFGYKVEAIWPGYPAP